MTYQVEEKSEQKNLLRKQEIKDKIVNSLQIKEVAKPQVNLTTASDKELVTAITYIDHKIGQLCQGMLLLTYNLGKIFNIFKTRYGKQYIAELKKYEEVTYSPKYISFIVRLHDFLDEHPRMLQSNLGVRFIKETLGR